MLRGVAAGIEEKRSIVTASAHCVQKSIALPRAFTTTHIRNDSAERLA